MKVVYVVQKMPVAEEKVTAFADRGMGGFGRPDDPPSFCGKRPVLDHPELFLWVGSPGGKG
jgi:hypothetical protein